MKTKEIILKESPNTDEETLEHCLTAIQAMLDMDDFERAYDYLNGFVSEIITQTREETIREVEDSNKDYLKKLCWTGKDIEYFMGQYNKLKK
jgi:hypothetical protein